MGNCGTTDNAQKTPGTRSVTPTRAPSAAPEKNANNDAPGDSPLGKPSGPKPTPLNDAVANDAPFSSGKTVDNPVENPVQSERRVPRDDLPTGVEVNREGEKVIVSSPIKLKRKLTGTGCSALQRQDLEDIGEEELNSNIVESSSDCTTSSGEAEPEEGLLVATRMMTIWGGRLEFSIHQLPHQEMATRFSDGWQFAQAVIEREKLHATDFDVLLVPTFQRRNVYPSATLSSVETGKLDATFLRFARYVTSGVEALGYQAAFADPAEPQGLRVSAAAMKYPLVTVGSTETVKHARWDVLCHGSALVALCPLEVMLDVLEEIQEEALVEIDYYHYC
ncbi:hypothetical protein DIPPA_24505 [Diplonema papillatum]|nr:hypothetical protein DIPPA_24425 [Diplonema papillatum]KAJ9466906.1 hypothetical protein DIPPA_24505 [Diplonema papillatum]